MKNNYQMFSIMGVLSKKQNRRQNIPLVKWATRVLG